MSSKMCEGLVLGYVYMPSKRLNVTLNKCVESSLWSPHSRIPQFVGCEEKLSKHEPAGVLHSTEVAPSVNNHHDQVVKCILVCLGTRSQPCETPTESSLSPYSQAELRCSSSI